MKKTIAIVTVCVAAAASALDNTISNDFWDTTRYENPVTSSEASAVGANSVSSFPGATYFSTVVDLFSTMKNGLFMLFR